MDIDRTRQTFIFNFINARGTFHVPSVAASWCLIAALASSCSGKPKPPADEVEKTVEQKPVEDLRFPGERHFESLQQLTFGGENAEAYFNADATEIVFQSTRGEFECDQIFRMDADGKNPRLVSTGMGRTTCGYIFPDQPKILYSSSHATLKTCPPKPDYSRGYVWPLLPDFDIYVAGPNGENPTALAPHPGYDAEGVVAPTGDGIVFTSTRSGDIDIWFMRPDGTGLKQLTTEVGYDGGAFFSLDGQKIVYRANHPDTDAELQDYKALLADDLVRPSVMDLWVMDRDGSNKRKILSNGAANFAPYFHPDGERIIFASNMDDDGGRNFDLYMINVDGTGLERITFAPSFDAFPMFSHDGTKLIFASNRFGEEEGETNVFIAEWADEAAPGVESELTGDALLESSEWAETAKTLSAPRMKGRGLGSEELAAAAEQIAARFAEAGLKPAGDDGFFQTFPAATSKTLENATLAVGDREAELDEEFHPFPFSSSGSATGDAVFVGYGITSAEHDYDDYAGVDADGKIAVAFRFEPGRSNEASKFDGTTPTRVSDLRFKGINARHHGASALLVVNPPPEEDEKDVTYAFDGTPSGVGIPTVHLTWAGAARLFGEEPLRSAYEAIEKSEKPASKALGTTVDLEVKIDAVETSVANVVGKLEGKESARAIVIGAHYDHLGLGGEGSLAPESKEPHLGADDNASGVASIVELAEALAAVDHQTDIYFVAFTGEESGLLGSHWFVEHPPLATEKIEAMLNFDMVGRLEDGNLTIFGTGTGKGLIDVIRRAQVGLPLDLSLSSDGYGPSDQMAFYARKIPVLHFFTGTHEDYHRPSDTADKLNPEGATTVNTMALRVAHELASRDRPLPYIAVASPSAGDSGGDGKRGYGPYFGSIPAFGGPTDIKGVKLNGARSGSPADEAGIEKGDVIVKFGEYDVTTLKDYAFALRQHQPGDEVQIVVNRDGTTVTLKATLQEKSDDGSESKSPHGHGTSPHGKSPHGHGTSPHGESPHHHGNGEPETRPTSQPERSE
jgi:Tol biopolymer transport system component